MTPLKRFSSLEILEIIRDLVEESLPSHLEGELHLRWDDADGVEVFFTEKNFDESIDETLLN